MIKKYIDKGDCDDVNSSIAGSTILKWKSAAQWNSVCNGFASNCFGIALKEYFERSGERRMVRPGRRGSR